MLPDGITECRHCGQPCHGVAGSSCDDCAWRDVLEDGPRELAEARRELAEIKQEIDEARAAWEADNETLLDDYRALQSSVAERETDLRNAALEAYERYSERKPATGVTVKQYTVYHYSDADALEWAKSKGMCLRLDRTAFERQAKALAGTDDQPAWLRVERESRATIATDLDAALGSELDGGRS